MVSYSGTIRQTLPGHQRALKSRMTAAQTLLSQPIATEAQDIDTQIEKLQVVQYNTTDNCTFHAKNQRVRRAVGRHYGTD